MGEQLLPFQISGRRLDYSINDAETIGVHLIQKFHVYEFILGEKKKKNRKAHRGFYGKIFLKL